MKICVIFTGGTIGSYASDGVISLKEKQKYKLLELFKQNYGEEVTFVTKSPLWILSENAEFSDVLTIYSCVKETAESGEFDGIIVTHGTDSLQFTASALAYLLDTIDLPVVLVSSNKVLGAKGSNGLDNFHMAVEFIGLKEKGVFVSYKNRGENPKIFLPNKLLPSVVSSDWLLSTGEYYAELINGEVKCNLNILITESEAELPRGNIGFSSDVLYVKSFVGMGNVLSNIDFGKIKHIVLDGYHSGTLPTGSKSFIGFCKSACDNGIKLYTCGVGGDYYSSVKNFSDLGILNIPDMSPIALYVKLCLLSYMGRTDLLTKRIANDI
jgi:L-asparaginase